MKSLITATCGISCLLALSIAATPRAFAWTLDSDVTFPSNTARGWAFGRSPGTENNAVAWVNVTSKITEQSTVRDADTKQCDRTYNNNFNPPEPLDIVCTQFSVDTTLTNNANYCAPVLGLGSNNTPATSNTCETWRTPPASAANLEQIGGGYCNWLITSLLSNPDYTFIIERRAILGGTWQQTYGGQDACVARSGAYSYRTVYADIYGNRGPLSNTLSTNCNSVPQ
jgi:hypothetical protein